MGTALVPFKDWKEFSAWKRNIRRKGQAFIKKLSGFPTMVLIAVAVLAVLCGMFISPDFSLAVVVAAGAIGFFERVFGDKKERRNQIANLPIFEATFPCPHCNKPINLGHAWICGWCKEEHKDWMSSDFPLCTVVTGCSNPDCEPTDIHDLAQPKGEQAALQCPHCRQHIVLDPVLYNDRQCYQSPYHGVARMIGDEAAPAMTAPVTSVIPPAAPSKSSEPRPSKHFDI